MTGRLARFAQDEFVNERWSYKAGQHVTFCGPNGRGKTTLTFKLLERSATSELPAVFFGMKPRDEVVDKETKRLGYEKIERWPPPLRTRWKKPPGYLLRPPTVFDPFVDDERFYREYRSALLDSYKRGNRIVVTDEHYGVADLGLTRELITLWSRGRAMGCGLWGGVQKPSHIPAWGFNNAEHLFLYNEPDLRNVKRFAEFGGIDTKLLAETVTNLGYHEALYLRRRGAVACIVNSQ
jgi:hypothetical protein